MLLGYNVRIPSMLTDRYSETEHMEVTRVLSITDSQPLSVIGNADDIVFRKYPYETLSIGGDEGCMCTYWVFPKRLEEQFVESMLSSGLRYSKGKNSDTGQKLTTHKTQTGGITNLSIELWDGKEKTASYTGRFRSHYFLEDTFSGDTSKNSSGLQHNLRYWILYLLQHNVWNYLLDDRTIISEPPLKQFLAKAVKVVPESDSLPRQQVSAKLISETHSGQSYKDSEFTALLNSELNKCGGAVTVKPHYDKGLKGYSIIFTNNGERVSSALLSTLPPRLPPKVFCRDGKVYSFTYNRPYTESLVFHMSEYDLSGKLLAISDIKMPPLEFKGVPARHIIGFSKAGTGHELTVLDIGRGSGMDIIELSRYIVKVED
jgi:hypothetical protein